MQNFVQYILVPTDFSIQSAAALQVAAQIARRTSAQIVLLHIVDSLLYKSMWAGEEILADTANPAVAQIITELKTKLIHFTAKYAPDRIVSPCVAFQNIYLSIAEYAKKYPNCLIVMGSKGTGDTSFLMGSNTEKIIRMVSTPVLVVKGNGEDFAPKNICFAADFTNTIALESIAFVLKLQQTFSAKLQLLKIITPQHFELSSHTEKTLQDFAKTHQIQNYSSNFYNHYTEYEGILAFAESNQTDLICMTTNGSTGFMQIMLGSIAEDVANHAKISVLTYRN